MMIIIQSASVRGMRFLCLCLLMGLGALFVRAENIAWTGTAGTDWFVADNWDLSRVPADDDTVLVDGTAAASGTMILSNATASLSSFVITNAVLVFTNWTTSLNAATVEIRDQGVLTLPPPFEDNAMSNRVHIACQVFHIAEGGVIDAAGKGYASDHGPGKGKSTNTRAGGGGHGGHGGMGAAYQAYGGIEYDSLRDPVAPGSGGAFEAYSSGIGGAGGGAVFIEAASSATIDGVIDANGQDSPLYGGGGSGGAIMIECGALGGGASGALSANGGTQHHLSGSGGGGRIAVHYAMLSGTPRLRFSTAPGGAEAYDPQTQWFKTAYPGTLFLTDLGLLAEDLTDGRFQGVRLFTDGGIAWTVDSLSISNTSLRLADDGFQVTVRGDLTLFAGGGLGIGADNGQQMARLVCGGALIVTNGGTLSIYSGATNGVVDHGALVSVTNDIHVHDGSWIYPYSHTANGGSVLFRARNVAIGENGGFFATARGFSYGKGPGKGTLSNNRGGGGGYGGVGGRGVNVGSLGGKTYGAAVTPLDPGSGSGVYFSFGGPGGGLVRIEASDRIVNDGQIVADGGVVHTHSGGGSGGGVSIRAAVIEGDGLIQANGGNGSATYSGGGGGGRIAIITQSDRFTGEQPGTYIAYAGSANGRISVLGATVGYLPGTNGTFHVWRPQGTLLMVH